MVVQASETVSCRKCGGAATMVPGQDYHRCDYCSSLIQVAEISRDRILPTGALPGSDCPSCSEMLKTGLIEGRRTLYCGSCFGLLLAQGDFASIVHERQRQRISGEPAEPRPISPAAFDRHLNCPSCLQKMEVHPYYGPGNVVVDSCSQCGFIWLDHGELTRIEQASKSRSLASSGWQCDPVTETDSQQPAPENQSGASLQGSTLRSLADLLFFDL